MQTLSPALAPLSLSLNRRVVVQAAAVPLSNCPAPSPLLPLTPRAFPGLKTRGSSPLFHHHPRRCHFTTLAATSTSTSHLSTTLPTLEVISKHIQCLQKKKDLICQLKESLCQGKRKYPDAEQREVLRSEPSVVHQIHVLEKLFEEISSGQLASLNPQMDNHPLGVISKQLQHLLEKQLAISQMEDQFLRRGESLDWTQVEVLGTKSSVVHQIDVLRKVFGEVLGQLHLRGAEQERGVVKHQLDVLADVLTSKTMPASDHAHARESVGQLKEEFRPSMNENESGEVINPVESGPLDKQRYLCISDGFEMYCLDPKQKKDQSFSTAEDVLLLPKIATLKEHPFVSLGSFKLGSDVYMIGGLVLPAIAEEPYPCPWRIDLFDDDTRCHILYRLYQMGSSRVTYRLSLADDGTLSHSESNIAKLNKPKLWPIVEKINGQIHVIDSVPLGYDWLHDGWKVSHEVLNLDSRGWIEEIQTIEGGDAISSHLVVGDRIYAETSEGGFLVFDSKTKKWSADHSFKQFKELMDIFGLGIGRCLKRGFPYGGEPSDPLYVLISLGNYDKDEYDPHSLFDYGVYAVAYLITSTGQVVCFQRLLDFFTGPVWPCIMVGGTIIQVDDEEEEGKTMCSIVTGTAWDDDDDDGRYVFINTFAVEMLTDDAALKVGELMAKGSEAWPVEQDFVRVHIKDKRVYKTDAALEGGVDSGGWLGVRACFL